LVSTEKYPWYEKVGSSEPLLQGDFVDSCPIIVPPSVIDPSKTVETTVIEYDAVIMSQSCDLIAEKLELVLMCPLWSLKELGETNTFFGSSEGKEALRKGHSPGYHLLNKCKINGLKKDHLVVDFRSVYSVSFDFLQTFAKSKGERIRLLPPYREHLSQSFARFFMRVGLPVDIPKFE